MRWLFLPRGLKSSLQLIFQLKFFLKIIIYIYITKGFLCKCFYLCEKGFIFWFNTIKSYALAHLFIYFCLTRIVHTQPSNHTCSIPSLRSPPPCIILPATLAQFFTYLPPITWPEKAKKEKHGEGEKRKERERRKAR